MYAVAVDTGGTFTDVAVMSLADGRLWTAKSPSTPHDPSHAFMDALTKALAQAGVSPAQVSLLFHGTTVATNAILEGKWAQAALITTEGFRYMLDIGRHDGSRQHNIYTWIKPERPITPDRIFEVHERIGPQGEILEPLNPAEIRALAEHLAAHDLHTIAVSLLHSYTNPVHEQAIAGIIRAVMPDAFVSQSSAIFPAFREFERTMLTALNACVMPVMSRYLSAIHERLDTYRMKAPLFVMQSNGGLVSSADAVERPVYTVLSGPAAGVMGACAIGRVAGYTHLISLDMGGTSTDVCLLHGGIPSLTTAAAVGPFPLQTPIIDLTTIGAGGGSIARVLPNGSLVVGPESAGADPGPVCYGRGGREPTVTDANLVLGRIPSALLGGEVPLDLDRARDAIADRIARPLGMTMEQAAHGIVELANHHMLGAIRAVSLERGYDPRAYTLVAFGGAGPAHAGRLAELLGIETVLIPPNPGVLSTLGLLSTDLRRDFVATCLQQGPRYELARMQAFYDDLEAQARAWLMCEAVPAPQQTLRRLADVRYPNQGYELLIDVPVGPVAEATLQTIAVRFHEAHHRLYGHAFPHMPIQIVNLRVTATGSIPRPPWRRLPHVERTLADAQVGMRRGALAERGIFCEVPVYDRARLVPGLTFSGPAIVDQPDTTVVVFPGHRVTVDEFGNLRVTLRG